VQVHHDEGAANRIDPESCANTREGIGEALTGERIGQPFGAILEVAPAVPSGASGLRRAPVVSDASYPSCSLEDLAMRTYDFSPLFRSTIGFDRLFDLAEIAQRATEEGYPPYNIERLADDRYQITLAVAGFSPDEVLITAEQNVVTIAASDRAADRASPARSRGRHR
jgi:hypothetical protein